MKRRIFIHHDGALGDVLLSLPVIGELRKHGDSICLAGRGDVAEFLKGIDHIDEGLRSDSALFLPLFSSGPNEEIRDFLAGFDEVYVFCREPSSVVAGSIGMICPATKVIRTIPPPGLQMHVSDFRMNQILTDWRLIEEFRLQIPPSLEGDAGTILGKGGYDFKRPLIVIHPGSGGIWKRWPVGNFAALIRRLREKYKPFFVILSGPAETGDLEDGLSDCLIDADGLYISGHGLATVASILSLSHLYVGNDSGISHLAASVSKGRVIAIFGPTDPVLWRPRGSNVEVISSDMECAPCETGRAGEGVQRQSDCGSKCLAGISVEQVLDRCDFSVA